MAMIGAAFTAQTSGAASLTGADLTTATPTAATGTRLAGADCRIDWTPAVGVPAGVRYEILDGGGVSLAAGLTGTSHTLDVGTAATVPSVRARVGNWYSAQRPVSAPGCVASLGAPTGLAVTDGDGQGVITWNAPANDGGSVITGYQVLATPSDGSLPTRSCSAAVTPRTCTLTGLTNGVTYTYTVRAVNANGNGPAGTVTGLPYPATIMDGTDLAVWLDARATASLSPASDCSGSQAGPGATVGCWKNRGNTGGNAVAFDPATYTVAAINGHAALRFDRTRPNSYRLNGSGIGAVGSANRTVLAVARARTTLDATTNYAGALAVWPGVHSGFLLNGYPNVNVFYAVGFNSSNAQTRGNTDMANDTPVVLSGTYDDSSGALRVASSVNGNTPASTTTVAGPWRSYGNDLRIGAASTSLGDWSSPLDGDVGEVIVLKRNVTAAERRILEEYLGRKWAQPLTPSAPLTVEAVPGDKSATVTWVPSAWDGGSPIIGYTITATPTGSSTPVSTCVRGPESTSCTLAGLQNGQEYQLRVVADNALGYGPAGTTTAVPYPASIMSGAAMPVWLDAMRPTAMWSGTGCTGSTIGSGDVGCWKNNGGLGGFAIASSPATLTPARIGTRPALVFDRTAPDGYELTAPGLGAVAQNNRTLIAVANGRTSGSSAPNGWGAAIGWAGEHTGLGLDGYPNAATGGVVGWNTSDATTGGVSSYSGSSVFTGSFSDAGGRLNAGLAVNSRAAVDSTPVISGSWRGGYTDTAYVGSFPTPGSRTPLDGDIGEVIVLNRTLTATETRTVEEYLSKKWEVAITPGPPQSPIGFAGPGQITASWSAPAYNGRSAITSYTATAQPGGRACTTASMTCVITGLSSGVTYAITVTATNAVGTGPGSTPLSVAVPVSGMLSFTGDNTNSLAGDSADNTRFAAPGPATADWSRVSVGAQHVCAIKTNGTLWCWGANNTGQLGVGDTTGRKLATQVGTDSDWAQVAAGSFTCATKTTGSLWCWGPNGTAYRLGQPGDTAQKNSPVRVGTDTDWSKPAVGGTHACAIKTTNALYCWGENTVGQIGVGDTTTRQSPTLVASGSQWTSVDVGSVQSCGVRTAGTLWCWGSNANNDLGTGTGNVNVPTQVGVATTWTSVTAEFGGGCARRSNNDLYCWGRNDVGQIGNGTTGSDVTAPTQVTGSWTDVVRIGSTTCALRSDGTRWCWGQNSNGQFGNGTTSNASIPTQMGTETWARLSIGGSGGFASCAISATGVLGCAGWNSQTQLGRQTPSPVTNPITSAQAAGLQPNWTNAAAGSMHACGVLYTGSLWCWGENGSFQLGDGSSIDKTKPTMVGSDTDWVAVAAGAAHSCGRRIDAMLWCWGANGSGQLGLGDTSPRSGPVKVGSAGWTDITSRGDFTCGRQSGDGLWCWGANGSGQLGQGDTTQRNAPARIGTGTWTSVSAGVDSACAVRSDATLWCWGNNADGQVGDGTTTSRPSPVQLAGTGWRTVSVGGAHACAVKTDGTLWCWGKNADGQLGLGSTTSWTAPQQVGSATDWWQVSAGSAHTCARSNQNLAQCWGDNATGQLGVGDTGDRSAPTPIGTAQWLAAGSGYTLAIR